MVTVAGTTLCLPEFRLIPGSFIDDVLRERVTDLLFEVRSEAGGSYSTCGTST
jgi:hypothetical protein